MQTRTHSMIESLANTGLGFIISLAAQVLIFPMFGIVVSLGTNTAIVLVFTVISIARSYILRRLFNKFTVMRNAQ